MQRSVPLSIDQPVVSGHCRNTGVALNCVQGNVPVNARNVVIDELFDVDGKCGENLDLEFPGRKAKIL